ncbi:hypothetical protein [Nocardia arizonensis]|uniref:hypothetical protein n=1 Tax=Nocardia arizonensis TaxID=1141647 RepID=UPI0012E29707|nr:hypothetical protein [Nocardia arizonensis]
MRGDDVLNEMIAAAGGALGVGGLGGALVGAAVGRRGRKVDALEKIEGIATRLADKATEAADKRVAQVEAQLAAYEVRDRDRDERRRLAAALHTQWDNAIADQIRALGGTAPPPPPLEVV